MGEVCLHTYMKNIIDFLSAQVLRVIHFVDNILGSTMSLAENVVNASVRVLLCVILYKVAFQNFLLDIASAL